MRVAVVTLGIVLLSVHLRLAFCEENLLEALRLLERLGGEGIDISLYVEQLNRALELYQENRTAEANALMIQVLGQLRELDSHLPSVRFQRWLRVGMTVAGLLVLPPLFYYVFPRVYALTWAYTRRSWIVRKVSKRESRR